MRRPAVVGWAAASALSALVACGNAKSDHAAPAGSSAGGLAASGKASVGGAVTGGNSGVSFGGSGPTGSGGTSAIDACVETAQKGRLVPLDMYIMLDTSSSMLEPTTAAANAPTKWDAVRAALESFLKDPGSDGIGVGIQYFPLSDPTVPATCTSDAQCGTHGPCFLKFCQNAGPGIFPCAQGSECVTGAGENVGPCVPLTYCWPPPQSAAEDLVLCHDVRDCPTAANAQCVPFNECSGNTDYGCPVAGQSCGTSMGMALGTCRAFNPTSACVHTAQCAAGAYSTPAVDIAPLPAAATPIVTSFTGKMPAGDTPTAPALTGALSKAHAWAAAHPDHTVVALLATDGQPTECITNPDTDPSGITGVRTAAAAGLSSTPSVSTFVIGVFGPTETTARKNLNEIAVAGGTDAAFMVDTSRDVTAQFLSALNQIRATQLACEYLLPEPPVGQSLDFARINVDFTNNGATERVLAVRSEAECDSTSGGWFYDQDPLKGGNPTKISICAATCARFRAAQQGAVQIKLGCQTMIR